MGSVSRLREKSIAQSDLGRAEAHLRSGRAFLLDAMQEIWDEAAAGLNPDVDATSDCTTCRGKGGRSLGASG